ncbi:MAG: PIN domain protein, partial [Candidatus Acidiferrales bacterium]
MDTSVLGGCFDPEFAEWSKGLVRDFRAARFVPVLSDVTAAEVRSAPHAVQEVHQELLLLGGSVLPVTSEALALVAAYQERRILATRFRTDMLPIALATLAEVDALVSWNFKHIVKLEKIRLFNE